ncbi:MAG TPA: hypothetical protein VHT73_00480 [Thermodesulfobacteriota bacterium]|nr:hypothetical protein [Thermodesulfobacteriota bacterium]
MSKYIVLTIIILGILIYSFLQSGDDPSEIEAVFNEVIDSGKKKDLGGVMEHFSINYRDDYGITYPVVKNIVKNFFKRFDGFEADYSNLVVSINENEEGEKQAVANLDVQVSGIRNGIPVPILGDEDTQQNITVTLIKSKLLGWKIVKVEGIEAEEGF